MNNTHLLLLGRSNRGHGGRGKKKPQAAVVVTIPAAEGLFLHSRYHSLLNVCHSLAEVWNDWVTETWVRATVCRLVVWLIYLFIKLYCVLRILSREKKNNLRYNDGSILSIIGIQPILAIGGCKRYICYCSVNWLFYINPLIYRMSRLIVPPKNSVHCDTCKLRLSLSSVQLHL